MPSDPSPDFLRYGRFDDTRRVFVLEKEPPRKWRNRHYNRPDPTGDELWAEISNLGDGPVCRRDAAGNQTTLVSYDQSYVYVRDDETLEAFCPGGAPLRARMGREPRTTYHAAWTETEAGAFGLTASRRSFVPHDAPLVVWTVRLRNTTERRRRVSVFAFAQFQLTGVSAEGRAWFKDNASQTHPELGAVLVTNRARACPESHRRAFLATTAPAAAVRLAGYRDDFTREDYGFGTPRLLDGWDASGSPGVGPDCAGIVQVSLELAPGEEGRVDFLLGPCADPAEVERWRARFDAAAIDAACAEQTAREDERASRLQIETGRPEIDALTNHFAKKQMVYYLIDKSGFRDNLQNDMGLAMCDYPLVRANLLRALASQYPNGDVPHGFRPLNLKPYADKPCWALHCVPWIIKESGDFALLDEVVPFFRSEESGTVWEHLLRAMRFLASATGAHGLCDQRFADWDDGLEPSERTGARESVMVTQQFCLGLLEMAELAGRRGDAATEAEARALHADFSARLNAHAWDEAGGWYQRTLCEGGYVAGSSGADEGKIYLYCQSWAVLSRTAPAEREERCMRAADRLCETDVGLSLVEPPYSRFDERIGRKSAMRPGYATNGGAYCHAAGFHALAHCLRGDGDAAWRVVRKTAPGWLENPLARSGAEPFAWVNCYDRVPEAYGRAQYAWRTGTASWFTMVIVEWILGARRSYDGLHIDPCLPANMPRARLTRTFRGAVFEIEIDNREDRRRGVRELWLDGARVEGCVLPDLREGRHMVRVVV